MIKIKAKPLSKEEFAPYGEYYTMDCPQGHSLDGEIHKFYPDRVVAYQGHTVAFSPLVVKRPEELIVKQAEYHSTTCEVLMPLNDDMILHVAEPSAGVPIPAKTKAFIVPKHTVVKLKACIWHLAPLPKTADYLYTMVVLPECTYLNDCKVVDFKEDEHLLIEV